MTCKYCNGTGKVTLFTSMVDCDECKPLPLRERFDLDSLNKEFDHYPFNNPSLRIEIPSQKKIIDITQRADDYHAQLRGTLTWDCGKTPAEAFYQCMVTAESHGHGKLSYADYEIAGCLIDSRNFYGSLMMTEEGIATAVKTWANFNGFTAAQCGLCHKTANVLAGGTGYHCRCGFYNIQAWGHQVTPHDYPDYGPEGSVIAAGLHKGRSG